MLTSRSNRLSAWHVSKLFQPVANTAKAYIDVSNEYSWGTFIEKNDLKHQVTVEVDLKKFNVPAEFGLKTNTELKNLVLDHTTNLYLHTTKDKSEYTYQLYVHPKEAGKYQHIYQ